MLLYDLICLQAPRSHCFFPRQRELQSPATPYLSAVHPINSDDFYPRGILVSGLMLIGVNDRVGIPCCN